MSVIIRLQNLPWSANAMDIRQFFKGLSIPEGGVHIVGGEMGDAFIAFSTDEDARQAMMHDRNKINEVQVRLLLSSRAEMQKVIETARQQSMLALQNATAVPKAATHATAAAAVLPTAAAAAVAAVAPTAAVMQLAGAVRVNPQPPVITANSLQKILGTQLSPAPSFLAYQQQAGITYNEKSLDSSDSTDSRRNSSERRRRSDSRSPSHERSSRRRDRRDRNSRSRSRELDYKSRRSRRSRSRDRSRDRSRSRERNERHRSGGGGGGGSGGRNNYNNRDRDRDDSGANSRPKPGSINPWNVPPALGGAGTGSNTNNNKSAAGGYQVNLLSSSTSNSPNPFVTAVAAANANAAAAAAAANPNNPFAQQAAATSGVIPNAALVAAISSLANANVAKAANNSLAMMPAFQSYSSNSTTSSAVVNTYNVGIFANNPSADAVGGGKQSSKLHALHNPYTASAVGTNANMLMNANNNNNSNNQLLNANNLLKRQATDVLGMPQQQHQEPIAFANTNPYAQIYPNLFAPQTAGSGGAGAMVAAAMAGGKLTTAPPHVGAAYEQAGANKLRQHHSSGNIGIGGGGGEQSTESCCIKVSNICSSVSYSDLRRFFYGLYIPHNGIKMVNDRHGLRVGVAFIQFARHSNVAKALARDNALLKAKAVHIEPVAESEFADAEDSFRPQNRHNNNDDRRGNSSGGGGNSDAYDNEEKAAKEQLPFSVLFVKEIPSFATEQDVMKMFSAYTIIDILLTPSPENRRENIAHVRFSRDIEAKAALANDACHIITHRKVRVSAGSVEDMDRAKEKLRLANEQLLKEERAQAEQEEEARKAAEAEAEAKAKELAAAAAAAADDDVLQQQSADSGDGAITIIEDNDSNANADDADGTNDQMAIASDDEYMPQSIHEKPQRQQQQQSQKQRGDMRDRRLRQRGNSRFDCIPSQQSNDSNDCMPMSAQMPMPMPMIPQHGNNNNNNGLNNINNNNNNNMNNFNMMNSMPTIDEECFVIMKNCVYNTRINDIGDLLMTSNLRPKHVELLRNDRNLPSGEFIVEFRDAIDADIAIKDLNNTQFRGRNLRVYTIRPQQIADRLGKPFMNYFPGGGGNGGGGNGGGGGYGPPPNGPNMMMGGGSAGGMRGGDNNSGSGAYNNGGNLRRRGNNRRNRRGGNRGNSGKSNDNPFDNDMDDDMDNCSNDDDNDSNDDGMTNNRKGNVFNESNNNSGGGGGGGGGGGNKNDGDIPPKFNRSGCVIAMENVPFRADLKAIMKFFNEFDISPDDIIRRFNDDGSPTGDARVAFANPEQARAAFDAKRRKHIFNRTVYLRLL